MKPLLAASATVGILGLAGAAVVFAARGDPGNSTERIPSATASAAAPAANVQLSGFEPPPDSAIPDNDFGREVRLGQEIFNGTSPLASPFVGNSLRCASCHLDAGRLAELGAAVGRLRGLSGLPRARTST